MGDIFSEFRETIRLTIRTRRVSESSLKSVKKKMAMKSFIEVGEKRKWR
jgi:hypothetical protein